jgi:hypothetical protein
MKFIKTFVEFVAEKRSFVFDFDDTLAVTKDTIGILMLQDGKGQEDIEKYLEEAGIDKKEIASISSSEKYGGKIAQISSAGFRSFYDHALQTNQILHFDGNKNLKSSGTEFIVDFSDAANIENPKPIEKTIKLMKKEEEKGNEIKVVTGRKLEKPIENVDGEKVMPTNKKDIAEFLQSQGIEIAPSDIHSAADVNSSNVPKAKAEIIADKIAKPDIEKIEFFDDDYKNTQAVKKLGKVGKTKVNVYHAEFSKGKMPFVKE